LLERHLTVAHAMHADVVVKIPSDCPLIDPQVIDRVLARCHASPDDVDYVSNLHPATYPDGNDVEAISIAALEAAFYEASRSFEREHTTPFIWERPQRFRVANVAWETGEDLSMTHRWTLDYPEDYQFIRTVYERLWSPERPLFSMSDILQLLGEDPRLADINARYCGVNWYRHHLGELAQVRASDTRHPAPSPRPSENRDRA
jgi:spore coat polysaccharide biosynthesis protein SpsF